MDDRISQIAKNSKDHREVEFELIGIYSFFEAEDETNSWNLMQAQEQNGSVNMLDDPEEDAWDSV